MCRANDCSAIYFAGIDRHARSFSGSADAKGDFETESRAAVRRRDDDFDMPNTMLPTLTREALEKETGCCKVVVQFGFYMGDGENLMRFAPRKCWG